MSKLCKITAIILVTTFLMSLPLTILTAEADIVKITFTLEYDESYGRPTGGPPGQSKPPKDDADEYKIWFNRYTVGYVPMEMVVYTLNPNAEVPLDNADVFMAISLAADAWDVETEASLVADKIQRDGETASIILNGENALFFGDYPETGVIAVASVWASRRTKQMVECDILFDTDFVWGVDGSSSFMDLQNIATHEFGHCFNLADIYDTSLDYLTMYGYSTEGDIEKRSLEEGI